MTQQAIKVSPVVYSDALVNDIASVTHEANRALCQAFGDDSQVPWEDAPDWQVASALKGVRYHLEHPEAGPEHSHEEWMREKLASGWKFGPEKDARLKEHPCLVPFDALPPEQQAKDYVFKAVVHAIARII